MIASSQHLREGPWLPCHEPRDPPQTSRLPSVRPASTARRRPRVGREALRAAIARHGGAIDWTVDHTGWVVTLYLPEEQVFSGSTLEDGLLSCLVWLVASESPAALA